MHSTHIRMALIAIIPLITVIGCSSHQDVSGQTPLPSTAESPKAKPPVALSAKNVDVAMTLIGSPEVTADGKNIAVKIDLSNHGKASLSSSATPPVHLGAHSIDHDGIVVNMDLARTSFATLAPGSSTEITILLPVQGILGYKAAILPVQEGIAWFDSWGTKPLVVGPFEKCTQRHPDMVCNKSGKPLETVTSSE